MEIREFVKNDEICIVEEYAYFILPLGSSLTNRANECLKRLLLCYCSTPMSKILFSNIKKILWDCDLKSLDEYIVMKTNAYRKSIPFRLDDDNVLQF